MGEWVKGVGITRDLFEYTSCIGFKNMSFRMTIDLSIGLFVSLSLSLGTYLPRYASTQVSRRLLFPSTPLSEFRISFCIVKIEFSLLASKV